MNWSTARTAGPAAGTMQGPGRRTLLRLALFLAGAGVAGPLARAAAAGADPRLGEIWRCRSGDCPGFRYDPMAGDPDSGIPPGTAFQDLPEDWYCPRCGAGKSEFSRQGG